MLITELRFYTACAAGSHESPPPLTVLDRSIGGVSIGMTEPDVIKLFGAPSGTLKITLGGGMTGRSVRYRVHGAPLLITYDSSGRVVSIEAYSPFFRTAGGIGPGSSLALVGRCTGSGRTSASSATGTARRTRRPPTSSPSSRPMEVSWRAS